MSVFHHRHSQYEEWLYIDDNGQIIWHGENDGAYFLRKGPQAREEILTLEEATRRFPEHAEEIRAALALPGDRDR